MPDETGELSCNPILPIDTENQNSPAHEITTKIAIIAEACRASHSTPNYSLLVNLATSRHGLCDDGTRKLAWPFLLGYIPSTPNNAKDRPSWRELPRHKDEDQVELDVNRSFIYYPKNESEKQLDRRKEELSAVITEVLRRHPMLSYFQGYHDIAQVFLLVLGGDDASEAVARLSLLRVRDFMLPSLSPSLAHLDLLPRILRAVQPDLCAHLSHTRPFFALAATLTLYAHDIQDYADIARLFDFFLAQPAVVSVYFFAIVVLSRKDELFTIPSDEPEMLHSVLSKLPKPLDLESLISRAMMTFEQHPPERLPSRAWAKISCYSVLKTTRTLGTARNQTLREGEELFEQHVLQLRRQELQRAAFASVWKYRSPVGGIGLVIAVGLLSIWLGKRCFDGVPGFGAKRLLDTFRMYW